LGGRPEVVLGLLAGLAGALAAGVASAVGRRAGVLPGALAGLCLLGLPEVQRHSGMIMAETLGALLFFGAATSFGRYLEEGKGRDAVGFGVWAALAILTKGTGLALALVPLLAAAASGRFGMLWRRPVWIGAAIVCVVAGPWTWATREMGHGGWVYPGPRWAFTSGAIPYYAGKLVAGIGWPALVAAALAAVGLLARDRRLPGREAAWLATALAVFAFQSVMPVGMEARHLLPAAPCLIALAFSGGPALAGGIPLFAPGTGGRAVPFLWAGALAALIAVTGIRLQEKSWSGFAPAARLLLERAGRADGILVSSDASGEGMLIAGVAAGDRRPGLTVGRASKLLAASTWSGAGYSSHFGDAGAVADCLREARVRWLVLDGSMPKRNRRRHHELLAESVRGDAGWRRVGAWDAVRDGRVTPGGVELFARVAP
jgi:hypothetical protein